MVDQITHIETRLQLVDSIPEKIDFLNECAFKQRSGNPALALSLARQAQQLVTHPAEYPTRYALSRQIEGFCLWRLRDVKAARDIIHSTLEVFEQHNELHNYCFSLFLMGTISLHMEVLEEAISYYFQSAEVAEKTGDEQRQASAYAQIGRIYWRSCDYQMALDYLHRALALYEKLAAMPYMADTLNNTGLVYMSLKEHKQALRYYRQALEIYGTLEDLQGQANALGNIGTAFEQLGRTQKALRYCHKALAMRRRLKDREGEANSLNSIGRIHLDFGDYLRALRYFIRSLKIFEENDNKHGQSPALNNIGSIYWNLGDSHRALTYFRKSLYIQENIEDRHGQALSLLNIGNVYLKWQEYDRALEYLLRSIDLFQTIGDQAGAANGLNLVGSIYSSMGDYGRAYEYIIRSIAVVQQKGMKAEESDFLITLGQIYARQNRFDEAITTLHRALTIAESMQARRLSYSIHRELADVYARNNNYEAAYIHFTTYHDIKEEVSSAEVEKKIKAVEISFEVARTRKQNTSYRQKNTELSNLLQEVATLNAHLQKVNEEKNELLGIVAHDLQNPLCSILIIGRLLRDDPTLSQQEQKEFIENIIGTVSHMSELISRLLSINALEQGRFSISLEQYALSDVAAAVMNTYQGQAAKKNITIHLRRDGNCMAHIDKNAITQVVDNLVSNAIKFSPQDRNIYLRTYRLDNEVRCEIQDEGPGLTEEDKKKLFGKFMRLSARPTGGEHSSGLGLSVVKKLVEAMDGRVWCESEVDKGATFIIALPAVQEEEPTAAEQ
jgi:signal transduction histidine kinase